MSERIANWIRNMDIASLKPTEATLGTCS